MQFLARQSVYVWAVLALAFFIRVPGIMYGLPLHLFGDEEVNVYSAFTMLQEHTLLPVLHENVFTPLLYEPPVTAYVFTVSFIPTLVAQYVALGAPTFDAFKQSLILDPSLFFAVARFLSVCASVASVFVVYRIGRRLFESEYAGLGAGLVYALSFIDVTLAATARHWEFGILFGLIGVLFALRAFDVSQGARTIRLIIAGVSIGVSVGTVYVALLAPFAAFAVLMHTGWRFWKKEVYLPLSALIVPSILVGALFVLVHPFPLMTQTATSAALTAGSTVFSFFAYYVGVLVVYDTPLVLLACCGFVFLWIEQRRVAVAMGLSVVTAATLMFLVFPEITRYAISLVPLLALLGGYGLTRLMTSVRSAVFVYTLVVLFAFYSVALFGRYEYLVLQGDSRSAARAWIYSSLPSDATVLIDSDTIRVPGTSAALAKVAALAPESVRAADRVLLTSSMTLQRFAAYPLFTKEQAQRSQVVQAALRTRSPLYLIKDVWWTPESGYGVVFAETQVASFEGQGRGATSLIHGGQPIDLPRMHILSVLYGIQGFGPTVTISRVEARTH